MSTREVLEIVTNIKVIHATHVATQTYGVAPKDDPMQIDKT